MENLLVSSVGGGTNMVFLVAGSQVFDMIQDDIGRFPTVLVILPCSQGSNMGRETRIYDDVVLARVTLHRYASDDLESMPKMEFPRYISKSRV